MNFFSNYPIIPDMIPNNMVNNQMDYMNNVFNRFNELENRMKRLEQRVMRLENQSNNDYNYQEPDNSLYMI